MRRALVLGWLIRAGLLCALLGGVAARGGDAEALTLRLGEKLGATRPGVVGLNLNAFYDHAEVRVRGAGMTATLRRAGVRSLRWPGGEKSDALAWSVPPFAESRLTLIRTGPSEWPSANRELVAEDGKTWRRAPLEFDEFIALCREVGAEPVVVVAFDSMYKPAAGPGGTAPTREELLRLATEWVRYANLTKGYGVKWWELGNESYFASYNGGARAADYARDFVLFAEAMRAIDPTIRLGANADLWAGQPGQLDQADGDGRGWLPTLLEQAGGQIDFLAVHDYPCYGWGSYAPYEAGDRDLRAGLRKIDAALAEWETRTGRRIELAVTEFQSADWLGHPKNEGWKHVNDLGHALVLADQIGGYLETPRVAHAQVWNTRWKNNASAPELWDTLDADNGLLPSGEVLALWSGALLEETLAVETPAGTGLRAFGQMSRDGTRTRVVMINARREPRTVRFEGAGGAALRVRGAVGFRGDTPEARELTRTELGAGGPGETLEIPGYSVLRVELDARERP